MYYGGVDIGGTKCAAVLGCEQDGNIRILSKEKFETRAEDPYGMLSQLKDSLADQIKQNSLPSDGLKGIGISCGGPLNSETGTVNSPPNLPAWDNIPAADYFRSAFHVQTVLQNDANACAVAEWKYGAGRGAHNMIFLTFGTGLGAGIILGGRLYCGSTDLAGEIGHIRIAESGPEGYGKAGSLEGYCSGGGLARLGRMMIEKERKTGRTPRLLEVCKTPDAVSAKAIADLAEKGDPMCREIYRISGEKLGYGLSILVDLLNPDVIVIGSIFTRSHHLLWDACNAVMERECLPESYRHCRVLPSSLGDAIGDVAALSVIIDAL